MDFSEKLFHRLADFATVHFDGRVVLTSALLQKPTQRFEVGGQIPGNPGYSAHCFCAWEIVCTIDGNL